MYSLGREGEYPEGPASSPLHLFPSVYFEIFHLPPPGVQAKQYLTAQKKRGLCGVLFAYAGMKIRLGGKQTRGLESRALEKEQVSAAGKAAGCPSACAKPLGAEGTALAQQRMGQPNCSGSPRAEPNLMSACGSAPVLSILLLLPGIRSTTQPRTASPCAAWGNTGLVSAPVTRDAPGRNLPGKSFPPKPEQHQGSDAGTAARWGID